MNAARLPRIASLSGDDCRLLVDSVVDYAIFMLDAGGNVLTWNPGAERIKGYAAEEIVGKHFSTFYRPEDASNCQRNLDIARDAGRFEDEGWRVRKDGTLFWANVVITALRTPDGGLRGYAKVTRDLTSRREMMEQLRLAEERFRLLVEGVADYAIYMLDPKGIVTTWNTGAQRMKGWSAPEILGKHFSIFFTGEDVADGKPNHELETARVDGRCETEGVRVRKNGDRFWANVVVTALCDDRGALVGFAKVTRDLTKERQLSEAVEAARIKDEFLATVSHELRTPLTAIVGWTKLLQKHSLDATVTKAVDVISRNADAQIKIVDDLLDVSRIISGKFRIEPRDMDLHEIVREALDVVRPSANAKGLSLTFEQRDRECRVIGDGERLRQVMWNLLWNAVKFTPASGAIGVRVERVGSNVTVTVSDDGKGIEAELLPHVFERFKQADQSITRRTGGLGLGLALVRHIVELHGGAVTASSDGPGKGATFVFTLPIRAVRPAGDRPEQGTRDEGALRLADLRVLVVDDEVDSRDLVSAVLESAGATVETAGSAADALQALARFRPHLLVSDIGMPFEDGYSLMRKIRALRVEDGGGIPAIALTAFTRAEDRTKALASGFTTHIGKPVDPDDLVAAARNLGALARH